VKALSIRQPWLWAILNAGKRIENRSRRDGRMPACCYHRGELYLHASSTMTRKEHREAADAMHGAGLIRISSGEPGRLPLIPFGAQIAGMPGQLHLGGIVGRCRVTGHLSPDGWLRYGKGRSMRCEAAEKRGLDLRWWGGGYALVLTAVEPLPLIACPGSRSVWRVPDTVQQQLQLTDGEREG
jgi:hypothetical protein